MDKAFDEMRLNLIERTQLRLWCSPLIPLEWFLCNYHRNAQVSTLAHMARFIIADITDPKAIPQELSMIVCNLQSVPVLPLLHDSAEPWGMFSSISRRSTVLPILEYSSESELIGKIQTGVINVAEQKAVELTP